MAKTLLKENQGLPSRLLLLFAIVSGLSIANIYYNQPLLGMIQIDLDISDFATNLVAMLTQAGYAAGLILITPLGDMFPRRPIILGAFSILILALIGTFFAANIYLLLITSFFMGACSVIPQIFVPIVAQVSTPETKERNVAIVLGGLLIGILLSRVVSGVVGDIWGWRTIYIIAAGVMAICAMVTLTMLPELTPTFKGRYRELMRSILSLIREEPRLRTHSLKAGFAFAGFLAFWSVLAFKMRGAPLFAGSDIVGLLGLCGIVGVLGGTSLGGRIKQIGVIKMSYAGGLLVALTWLVFYFLDYSYLWIALGIMIRDLGVLFIQLSNQTAVLALRPEATSRINTIFMTTYFICGATGSFLAGIAWQYWGWGGVTVLGLILISISISINAWEHISDKKARSAA